MFTIPAFLKWIFRRFKISTILIRSPYTHKLRINFKYKMPMYFTEVCGIYKCSS